MWCRAVLVRRDTRARLFRTPRLALLTPFWDTVSTLGLFSRSPVWSTCAADGVDASAAAGSAYDCSYSECRCKDCPGNALSSIYNATDFKAYEAECGLRADVFTPWAEVPACSATCKVAATDVLKNPCFAKRLCLTDRAYRKKCVLVDQLVPCLRRRSKNAAGSRLLGLLWLLGKPRLAFIRTLSRSHALTLSRSHARSFLPGRPAQHSCLRPSPVIQEHANDPVLSS